MYSSDISGAVDVAMNEAIRRSLADLGTSQNAENSESAGKKESDVEVETVNESDSEEHEHVTSNDVSAESMKPDATEEPVQDPCSAEPEIVVPGELGTNENAEPDIYVGAVVSSSADVDVHVDVEDSSATVAASEPMDTKPETFSFASDAEGATATILGSTLDKMAEAIDNLNWELERAADSSCGTEDDEGAKIVDGDEVDDEDDDDSTSSHNSWQVVSEDEQISRAAQALGSALFNSEMERSSENLSTLSNSGASAGTGFSTLATVPSTVRSLNTAPSQLLRWSAQLQQLQELGFTNDAESVDILESLTAANIGVDSDDEVTVEQVINVMMKDT